MIREYLMVMKDVVFFPNDIVLLDNNIITTIAYVDLSEYGKYYLTGYVGGVSEDRLTKITK